MTSREQERLSDPASHISMIHVEPDCIDHPVTRRKVFQTVPGNKGIHLL
jgi:hypothetical protein